MGYSAADPYEILGLPRDATSGVLRAQWRKALLACHPDGNGNGDPEQLEAVNWAYDTIKQRLVALDALTTGSSYPQLLLGEEFRSPAKSPASVIAGAWFLWPAVSIAGVRAGIYFAGFGWSWVLSVVGFAVVVAACFVSPTAQRRNAVIAAVMATIDVTYSVLPIAVAVLAFMKDRGRQ